MDHGQSSKHGLGTATTLLPRVRYIIHSIVSACPISKAIRELASDFVLQRISGRRDIYKPG